MRTNSSTARTAIRFEPEFSADHDAQHRRLLRDAGLVRRALRGVRAATSVTGGRDALAALEAGLGSHLLVTARFRELHPDLFAAVRRRAFGDGVRMSIVRGVAAFELDLAADGAAVLLQRQSGHARRAS